MTTKARKHGAGRRALWGLSGDRPKVHVNAPRGRQVRPGRRSGIKVHRCKFAADEVTVHDGIPVSTVARTLFDLAERSAPHELKSAWDEADRLKRLRIPEVARVYELGSWESHAHRPAFEKDRNRDTDHLLADYRTVRVTHRRLSDHPERLAAQLRTLLTKAGRPLRTPKVRASGAFPRRSPQSRSGFRRPGRPWLRARLSCLGRCPRSRR
jgi:hypothetical protein